MPLTALDIYKLLPKTNCGECGFPTCLAFAMQLATKKAAIDACPYASDDAKATLAGAAAPPIRLVAFGPAGRRIELGRETVLFRHEETFYHPPAIAVRLRVDRPPEELRAELQRAAALQFERVGQTLRVEAVALEAAGGGPEPLVAAAREADSAGLALLLCSDDPAVLDAAAGAVAASRPVLYAATAGNWEAVAQVARKHNCPLAVRGKDLQELADLTPRLAAAGVGDLLLDSGARGQAATLADLTQIRRLALRKLFRPLGYPALAFVTSDDPLAQVAEGTAYICKYAALLVTPALQPWQALALVTARQNIYTDPQKPIQVEPGIHTVGAPDADSPVLVTTNFSLTYFTVEADTEASRLPAWMVVVNTEGQSVMTAWAADKFNAETIAKAVESSGIAGRVKHRRLIIPGGVAAISGKLEELCGWQVTVGPRESAGIPAFLRTQWKQVAAAAS